jgi:hypothetical protein
MLGVEDHDIVQALSPERADQPLGVRIHRRVMALCQGRKRWGDAGSRSQKQRHQHGQ